MLPISVISSGKGEVRHMGKFITNSEVIKIFEQIEDIKKNNDGIEKQKEIVSLQNKIVNDLSFLVYSQVKSYRRFSNYDDLVQEGLIGLLRAVRKFNFRLFPNFFIYSERWIRHSVKRAASRFDVVYCPNKKRVVYTGLAESSEEMAADNPEEEYAIKEKAQKVRDVLNELSSRDKEIVERIFGFNSNPQTLRGIGPNYNLTHERIRQIKNQAISKLKKSESLNNLY